MYTFIFSDRGSLVVIFFRVFAEYYPAVSNSTPDFFHQVENSTDNLFDVVKLYSSTSSSSPLPMLELRLSACLFNITFEFFTFIFSQ